MTRLGDWLDRAFAPKPGKVLHVPDPERSEDLLLRSLAQLHDPDVDLGSRNAIVLAALAHVESSAQARAHSEHRDDRNGATTCLRCGCRWHFGDWDACPVCYPPGPSADLAIACKDLLEDRARRAPHPAGADTREPRALLRLHQAPGEARARARARQGADAALQRQQLLLPAVHGAGGARRPDRVPRSSRPAPPPRAPRRPLGRRPGHGSWLTQAAHTRDAPRGDGRDAPRQALLRPRALRDRGRQGRRPRLRPRPARTPFDARPSRLPREEHRHGGGDRRGVGAMTLTLVPPPPLRGSTLPRVPNPGSKEARARGCLCPLNRGEAFPRRELEGPRFVLSAWTVTIDCPLHGGEEPYIRWWSTRAITFDEVRRGDYDPDWL